MLMEWRDIKLIVHLADGLLVQAKYGKWTEEKYYKQVLEQYNQIKNEKQ